MRIYLKDWKTLHYNKYPQHFCSPPPPPPPHNLNSNRDTSLIKVAEGRKMCEREKEQQLHIWRRINSNPLIATAQMTGIHPHYK